MNNGLIIKIEISVNWHNPYKNGYYKEIDISIRNNSKDDIAIESISLVCNGKSYHIDKSLLASLIMGESEKKIECDTTIYQLLKFYGLISYNFYFLIKHSQGESMSNILNISTKPTYVC